MSRTNHPTPRTVIVGASAAGLSAAEALRTRGHEGDIVLVGAENHEPYDRPPLSKQALHDEVSVEALALRPPNHLQDLGIDLRRGVAAVHLDSHHRKVLLEDGTDLEFERLIIATGVNAKHLPASSNISGVHTLRTVDDSLHLQAALSAASRLVVIGGGFLGTEIAAAGIQRGVDVVLATKTPTLLENALGSEVGQQLTSFHQKQGIRLRTGKAALVQSLRTNGHRVTGVHFASGGTENADLVVVAIGSEPAVDWLRASTLILSDGVVCAADCSAGDGIYAVGDVARWHNPLFDLSMRIEHRTNAVDQALHVADRILAGDRLPYTTVPYFWSDQYKVKLQAHGYLRDHDEVQILQGSIEEGKVIALYRKGERLTGVLGAGAAKAVRQWRAHIESRTTWAQALEVAQSNS